jgi:branched-chain amino acid transport system permease protein
MSWLTRKNLLLILGVVLAYALLQGLSASGVLSAYLLGIVLVGLIYAIMAVGLNLITGFTGQFSIGHAAFMAIGAYVSAIMSKLVFHLDPAMPFLAREGGFLLSLLVGSAAAGLAAFLIGIPTLRLKGDYLCIATLGFNQIVVVVINNLDFVGGPRGFTGVPNLSNLPWIAGTCLVSIVLMRNFITSIHGAQCVAVREDEIAAESLRIDTTRYKVLSFVVASFFAGTAGGLLVHYVQLAHPSQFTFLKSIDVLLMLVVGGLGNIPGSIIAALALTLLPELLRFSQDLRLVIYPIILIIFVLKNPIPLLKRAASQLWTRMVVQFGSPQGR